MKAFTFARGIAISSRSQFRRIVVLALLAVAATLCAGTARAQNTQVTIEGVITSVGGLPGISVGDKYSMVVYYNPTQAPSSTSGPGVAYYSGFTLNAVVDGKDGNQNFSAEADE